MSSAGIYVSDFKEYLDSVEAAQSRLYRVGNDSTKLTLALSGLSKSYAALCGSTFYDWISNVESLRYRGGQQPQALGEHEKLVLGSRSFLDSFAQYSVDLGFDRVQADEFGTALRWMATHPTVIGEGSSGRGSLLRPLLEVTAAISDAADLAVRKELSGAYVSAAKNKLTKGANRAYATVTAIGLAIGMFVDVPEALDRFNGRVDPAGIVEAGVRQNEAACRDVIEVADELKMLGRSQPDREWSSPGEIQRNVVSRQRPQDRDNPGSRTRNSRDGGSRTSGRGSDAPHKRPPPGSPSR